VISFYGLLGLLDAFVRDQWPGVLAGLTIGFVFTSYLYERFIIERE
jgi:hypothetical protein